MRGFEEVRQAGKVGDLLTALRALTYRLDSGSASSMSVSWRDRSATSLLLAEGLLVNRQGPSMSFE